jgi:hypothetical protein
MQQEVLRYSTATPCPRAVDRIPQSMLQLNRSNAVRAAAVVGECVRPVLVRKIKNLIYRNFVGVLVNEAALLTYSYKMWINIQWVMLE